MSGAGKAQPLFGAGEMIVCLVPEGAPNLTMFQSYRVVDGSDPNTVVVIDDEGDTVAYETARFHGPRETYEDWIDRTAELLESYAGLTEH